MKNFLASLLRKSAQTSWGITALTAFVYSNNHAQAQSATTPINYPKVTGYVGVLHPLLTFNNTGTHKNFDGAYVGGLPAGINIWKSAKVGFSMEFVPFVRVADGDSRMNNFLFHPGALFALGRGYTLATRAAFETSGRYGFTPVLNKVIQKNRNSAYYVAVPLPARFGNSQPSSLTVAFQFGISF